ncbi:hypothetical protein PAXRUDRAFT_10315 [Paxillus rubicundulus Ve08.2h10]|uniref:Uncharacterized protein n=1 Tax=Paxillus rubicundulus Ve08.2h10 TaxID=930991 RepID=A0A0D0DGS3_9AGAM|nr:hypothetical protein PAXRUDRAFT_10315 [Paxillus rubicundulus Ve08.2h10]
MYCLWINVNIFPLTKNPGVHLLGAEHWLSPLSIKDGIKTELFNFIPKEQYMLMTHKDFGESIFDKGNFLKTVTLVKVLKAAFFSKSSLGSVQAPSPKPKAKLWEWRDTSAIFILSGDSALNEKRDKTQINYVEYYNYYHSWLLKGDIWSHSVFSFFNNVLFPATSLHGAGVLQMGAAEEDDDWELKFECDFEEGHTAPALNTPAFAPSAPPSITPLQAALAYAPPRATDIPAPPPAPLPPPHGPTATPVVVSIAAPSISLVMRDLVLGSIQAAPPIPPPPPQPVAPLAAALLGSEPDVNLVEAPIAKPKAKAKQKRKGKTRTTDHNHGGDTGLDTLALPASGACTVVSGTWKSKRRAN